MAPSSTLDASALARVVRGSRFTLLRRAALALATLAVATLALAARADAFAYWTNGDKIGRANLDGTGVHPSFVTGGGNTRAVAVDGAHVYWINDSGAGSIGRANLDGTGVDKSFITARISTVAAAVAVDGEHVYWVSRFADPERVCLAGECIPGTAPNTGAIGRANLDGTGVDVDFISGISTPFGVAVDATHIYWEDPVRRTIGRANLDGTGASQSFIGVGEDSPVALAVDGAHIYWGNGSHAFGRANLDGTGVEPRFITAPSSYGGSGIAVDAAHLYWVDGNTPIARANLDGTGMDTNLIDTGANGVPFDLAVDTLSAPPSNNFRFGGVKVNKQRGSAKLTVNVPVSPGELKLAKTTNVKGQHRRVEPAPSGKLKLSVTARGKAKKRLTTKGRATVKAKVTYTPDGGTPKSKSKTIKLVSG